MGDRRSFSPEVQERAVRMVLEHGKEHGLPVGGDPVDCRQDRLHHGDAASVGAAG